MAEKKRTRRKKIQVHKFVGILLLVLAIAITQIPAPGVLAAESSDFQVQGSRLIKYTGIDSTVVIPDYIKVIGPEAFSGASDTLANVIIPEGVHTIEYGAFSDCELLRRVIIPNSVTSIGRAAFSNCTSLNLVKIGSKLRELGSGVFAGCSELANVAISEQNERFTYRNGGIYNKSMTKLYAVLPATTAAVFSMPATVSKIEPYAFWGCWSLNRVQLSGQLKEIPGYAFSNCEGLEEIEIPYSVNAIGPKAFEDCTALSWMNIPASVTYINETAFDGCDNLEITAGEGTVGEESAKKQEEIRSKKEVLQQAMTQGNTADTETSKSEVVDVPEVVSEESGEIMPEVEESATEETGLLGQAVIASNQAIVMLNNQKEAVTQLGSENSASKNGKIEEQAFYRDESLLQYDIPKDVKEIGDFAFARSGLTSVTLPEGVETIGYAAFYHSNQLELVEIPTSVTQIDSMTFQKTKWLNQWMNESNPESPFLIVGDGILLAYRGKEASIDIPEGVKTIGADVFVGKEELVSVKLPASVKRIAENAFANCTNLKEISGIEQINEVDATAFQGSGITLETNEVVLEENLASASTGNFQVVKQISKQNLAFYDVIKIIFMFSLSATAVLCFTIPKKKIS